MIYTQQAPTPGSSRWVFQSLLVEVQTDADLNITGYRAKVIWKSDTGELAVDEGSGGLASTTAAAIKALNTGNFSAGTSLEQILMNRAVANGVLPAGAASGDPI